MVFDVSTCALHHARMRAAGIHWHTPPLGAVELRVLEYLWAHGEVDAKQVQQALYSERPLTLSTVQSTLHRLYRKNLLARVKLSHAYRYRARVSRSQLLGGSVHAVVTRLGRGELQALVSSFITLADQADAATLARLQRWIDEQEKDAGIRCDAQSAMKPEQNR